MTETTDDTETFTVALTEPTTPCPTPSISFPNTPEISFSGTTATCRIYINVGAPEAINDCTLWAWTGAGWVNLADQLDVTLVEQTVDLTWEMVADTEACYIQAYVINSCEGECTAWTGYYSYSETTPTTPAQGEFVDGTIDVPTSVDQGADIDVSFDVHNTGGEMGHFIVRAYMYNPTTAAYDIQVGDDWSDNISPNETVTDISMNWTAPTTGTSVDYELVLYLVT